MINFHTNINSSKVREIKQKKKRKLTSMGLKGEESCRRGWRLQAIADLGGGGVKAGLDHMIYIIHFHIY